MNTTDQFAKAAMQALLAEYMPHEVEKAAQVVAHAAYDMAEAMAREKVRRERQVSNQDGPSVRRLAEG